MQLPSCISQYYIGELTLTKEMSKTLRIAQIHLQNFAWPSVLTFSAVFS